ncbi:Hexadecenal dehydrogenase, partial [Coemansia sp. RSA 2703]
MGKEHSAVSGALSESALEYTSIDSIGGTVSSLRSTFASGQTRSLDFRKQQLRALLKGMRAEKKALLDAVLLDLNKSTIETDMYEFSAVEFEIGLMLENMDKWARPQSSWLSMLQPAFLMSRSEVRKEPLGTVVIIGAWNYPIRLTLLPL